jgi:hypothetical protein
MDFYEILEEHKLHTLRRENQHFIEGARGVHDRMEPREEHVVLGRRQCILDQDLPEQTYLVLFDFLSILERIEQLVEFEELLDLIVVTPKNVVVFHPRHKTFDALLLDSADPPQSTHFEVVLRFHPFGYFSLRFEQASFRDIDDWVG